MCNSSEIKKYIVDNYIQPKSKEYNYSVTIRSGDIHDDLNLNNRYPQVCSILGSNDFVGNNGLQRISIIGPTNGANTYFTYLIEANLKEN